MAKKEPTEEPAPAGKPQKQVDENPDFKFLVRIANTDIEGEMPLYLALPKIKGVGRRVSIRVLDHIQLDRYQRIGDMSDEDVDKIQSAVENIHEILPNWMMNRQKDFDSGDDIHVTSSEVPMTRRDDINRLKKIRAYRGIRHERGHKVRGQRLKSNGRTGLVLGVTRKKR
jgi:small subunit ribosomal protein S13